jgi:4-hydroxybenzoyl-CoA thioesterase
MTDLRTYTMEALIRFQHCDPAGIAFFARLDELLNAAFEDWCAAIGLPFAELMGRQRRGFPLVHATLDYLAPLRLGDRATIVHHVAEVGRASVTFDVRIQRDGETCVRGQHVRVLTSLDTHRAVELPASVRAALGAGAPA